MNLIQLKKEYSKRKRQIKSRLNDFSKVKGKDIFYELCFCLLTPQSKAKQAYKCELILREKDFLNRKINPLFYLKKNVRFHNNKTRYLDDAKDNIDAIFYKIKNTKDNKILRDWLVKNVKGYGMKEASHFLRNIGKQNLAILDRHILKHLKELNVIKAIPKSLTINKYLEIEGKFKNFSKNINIPIDELDLLFWSIETGEIFK
ncbi:N-glycosylase/DNA lyase [Candidatus Woesearchaeota archaeon]|nr:N-glycosylase/DNA lyase [Candidatus Woesearchaeota archaeon]